MFNFNNRKLKLKGKEDVPLKVVVFNNLIGADQKFNISQNRIVGLYKIHKKTFPTNKYKRNKLIRKYRRLRNL